MLVARRISWRRDGHNEGQHGNAGNEPMHRHYPFLFEARIVDHLGIRVMNARSSRQPVMINDETRSRAGSLTRQIAF
jgi:hypothetical protein